MGRTRRREWLFALGLVVALKLGSLLTLYVGWKFIERPDYKVDLWITRPQTTFIDNLANFDGAWFVRLGAIGYQRLAAGAYDLAAETRRLRVMDRLGYEQGRWPPEPGSGHFDRGYGYRHWPMLAWLIGALDGLGLDPVWSGVVLCNLFTMIYGMLLYFLAREDLAAGPSALAVALSQLHPGAYALSALYSESLFLALVAGAMLAARKKRWWLCGILGLVASATRIFGLVLAGVFIFEWLNRRAEETGTGGGYLDVLGLANLKAGLRGLREWPGLWWAALPVAGFGIVLVFFYLVSGDAMIWTRVHEENVYGRLNWPWLMMVETYHKGWAVWMKELPLHALLLVVIVLCFRQVRGAYWVWMVLFFLFHTSNGNHSYLRYQVECLPLFLALSTLTRDREWLAYPLLCLFAGLFGIFGTMFVNGYWVA